MDLRTEIELRGLTEEIGDRVIRNLKFTPEDLAGERMSPIAGELHAFAVDYVRAYRGSFDFLNDIQGRVARRAGTSPLQLLSIGEAKAVLNCVLADLRRSGFRTAAAETPTTSVTDPGIYEDAEGHVFKVQRSRQGGGIYAKRLVPIRSNRLTDTGDIVRWEWEYAPGAIRALTPTMRMDETRAREFGLRYGVCACCGRALKVAESVERGIGPVCIKWFRW
jgi:hypothetical protein